MSRCEPRGKDFVSAMTPRKPQACSGRAPSRGGGVREGGAHDRQALQLDRGGELGIEPSFEVHDWKPSAGVVPFPWDATVSGWASRTWDRSQPRRTRSSPWRHHGRADRRQLAHRWVL